MSQHSPTDLTTLTADLRVARQLTPQLRRVLHALDLFDGSDELQALSSAPPSLKSALLDHTLEQMSSADPEGLRVVARHLIQAEVRVKATEPGTAPAAPQVPAAKAQNTKPQKQVTKSANKASPAPKNNLRLSIPERPAAPTPPPPAPVFTEEMQRAGAIIKTLSASWDLPELSRYLDTQGVGIHPKSLRLLLKGQPTPDPLPEGLLATLETTPPDCVYTDPDDARNNLSPHYVTFFELQSLLPALLGWRDEAEIATRLREHLKENGEHIHIDRRIVSKLNKAEFNEGRDWIIPPDQLPAVQDALLGLTIQMQREQPRPPAPEAETSARPAGELPSSFHQRIKALRDTFGTNSFQLREAQPVLGCGQKDLIQHLLQMSMHGHADYVRRNVWRMI